MLYYPDLPLPLAMEFINTAYSRALDYGPWSALYVDSEFIIPEAYAIGTVDLTQNSTTVTGVGTVWISSFIGQQFLVNAAGPFYTIVDVTPGTTLTLDRPYGGETAMGQEYTIAQIYVTPPADFEGFVVVLDPANNWKLRLNLPQEWLDRRDAQRTYVASPWVLAAAGYNTSGRPRYELWPRQEVAASYPYRYIKRPSLMSASSDRPIRPLRGDVLRLGALAELSRWPGTPQSRNPYFGIDQHTILEGEFQRELGRLWREDQEIRQSAIRFADEEDWPISPLDANWLQTHDPNWIT